MYNNPETLKYKIGQKVTWQEEDGTLQQGIVVNIAYSGLEVIQGMEEILIPFDWVIKEK